MPYEAPGLRRAGRQRPCHPESGVPQFVAQRPSLGFSGGLVDLVGFEPTTSSMPWKPKLLFLFILNDLEFPHRPRNAGIVRDFDRFAGIVRDENHGSTGLASSRVRGAVETERVLYVGRVHAPSGEVRECRGRGEGVLEAASVRPDPWVEVGRFGMGMPRLHRSRDSRPGSWTVMRARRATVRTCGRIADAGTTGPSKLRGSLTHYGCGTKAADTATAEPERALFEPH